MMWWRGKGLWMAALVALVIVTAGRGGPSGMAAGLAAAAVLVFVLRGWAGEESSFYSFPVRYWPPVLLGCAVLAFFGR